MFATKQWNPLGALAALLLLSCCAFAQGSLLLVVMDDVGAEYLEFMPQGQDAGAPASTPALSSLADQGLVYTNCWSNPNCSATRASLLTGRYGHRTGVGTIIPPFSAFELPASEATIAERLQARGYATALFGKWHLGSNPESPCWQGYEVWSGSQESPKKYGNWERTDDTQSGAASTYIDTTYVTTTITDGALAWIAAQTGPWFAVVAHNAAHAPFHYPHGYSGSGTEESKYRAMIEHLDGEIGRLLAGVDLGSTTVIVVSDNGAPDSVALWPNTTAQSKGTAFRGGIEVAVVIAGKAAARAIALGKNVPGQALDGHAQVLDLYRTILRLMPGDDGGAVWPSVDSTALYSKAAGFHADARAWNFTERAEPLGAPPGGPYTELHRAVEEVGYKAIWDETGAVELYDVWNDPWETSDMLADGVSDGEQDVLDGLTARLAEIGL